MSTTVMHHGSRFSSLLPLVVSVTAAMTQVATGAAIDPLPPRALARLGELRWRTHAHHLAFTPDGRTLITGEHNQGVVIRCWDTATGRQTASFRTSDKPDHLLASFALSPDGKTLALSHHDHRIQLWSVPEGKRIRSFEDLPLFAWDLVFSKDGQHLFASLTGDDNAVRGWNVRTGALMLNLKGKHGHTGQIDVSPDGKKLAIAGVIPVLRVVEIATGKELFERKVSQGTIRIFKPRFTPDGAHIVWFGDDQKRLRLWDAATGKPGLSLGSHPDTAMFAAVSPDGTFVASSGGSVIHLWDSTTGKKVHSFPSSGCSLAFSPDSKRLASVVDGVLHIWDVATGKDQGRLGEHTDSVAAVAFSADGKSLLTACGDHLVRVWKRDGSLQRRIALEDSTHATREMIFSPDRKVLLGMRNESPAIFWDTNTGKVLGVLPEKSWTWDVAYCPDGKRLASTGDHPGIHLWDAAQRKEIRRLGEGDWKYSAVVFSSDGARLASLHHPQNRQEVDVTIWDPATGKRMRQWVAPWLETDRVLFTATGPGLITAGRKGAIRFWNVETGAERLKLVPPRPDDVEILVLSADGRTLAVGGNRGDITLWETATGRIRLSLAGHSGTLTALAFSADGRQLLSGSRDTTALLWDVSGLAGRTRPRTARTAKELDRLWDDLASSDATKAFAALWLLAEQPEETVAFLQAKLRPAQVEARRLARLIEDLDSSEFAQREEAVRQLEALGGLAEPALRRTLAEKPPLEVRRRIQHLLAKLAGPVAIPELMRGVRAVEVLETIGSRGARRLLKGLAEGAAEARLTREARASLRRLQRR